jgi:AraC family transcriptional activator of pobA
MADSIPNVDICTLSDHQEEVVMVSRFADYLRQHSDLIAPHRHNFYHLLLFTEGGGEHTIDFHHFEVKADQIYFMNPGQVHSWDFKGRVEGYVVNFSEDFFTSFLLQPDYLESFSFLRGEAQDSVLTLCTRVREEVCALFESLLIFSRDTSSFRNDMIRSLLLQVFIRVQLAFLDRKNERTTGNPLLKTYRKLIDQKFRVLKRPGEYAALLNVSPNHLNAICKGSLGVQAGQLIRDRVVLEAKRMLVNRNLSISEVAYGLNFDDNSYFSKFFRKEVGVSPELFREQHTRR